MHVSSSAPLPAKEVLFASPLCKIDCLHVALQILAAFAVSSYLFYNLKRNAFRRILI